MSDVSVSKLCFFNAEDAEGNAEVRRGIGSIEGNWSRWGEVGGNYMIGGLSVRLFLISADADA
jgi:hypothetical protein